MAKLIEIFGEIINPDRILYIQQSHVISSKGEPFTEIVFVVDVNNEYNDQGKIRFKETKQTLMSEINRQLEV